jgi:hypothetical protein
MTVYTSVWLPIQTAQNAVVIPITEYIAGHIRVKMTSQHSFVASVTETKRSKKMASEDHKFSHLCGRCQHRWGHANCTVPRTAGSDGGLCPLCSNTYSYVMTWWYEDADDFTEFVRSERYERKIAEIHKAKE